ncbi:hypothetical protein [Acinetobacter tianfuensis]|uniref:Uncharacterized protein n=1 Tax=Acinetobacter tianfuensis TaxID=2419603 RepID=A0A3A8EJP1_9GAMM|nr:hypothetical protein [Acinetobacter tianfuensis]RKG30960.1 hypothetical protein D7V32_09905 [Acinetobacter tianfuensis]
MIGYHNSVNADLKEIHNEGQYSGIFVSLNAALMTVADYGNHCYKVTFGSICEKSDIEDYLDENPEFLKANPDFVIDCEEEMLCDELYRKNQKLRALIALELGFDAVEENDGYLVVSGTVEYIGNADSEAVELEIEENW